jgi:methionyl-tRNA formyltransferase
MIRAVLFGSGELAVPALEALSKEPFELVAVVTQPDRPSGRGQEAGSTSLKQAAQPLGVHVFEPEQPGEFASGLASLKPNVIVVVDYGRVIPNEIIDLGPIVNLHPSLLPRYRGSTPIQSALLNGDRETGLTMIKLDEKLDHGAIISQVSIPIQKDNYGSLNTKIVQLIEPMLHDDLPRFLKGEISPTPQDENQATFTKKLSKTDGEIDWDQPTAEILNRIRALNPWPGTYTTWNGKQLKILSAETSNKKVPAGHVDFDELIIGTQEGSLQITELQLEGKKPLSDKAFLAGNKSLLGAILQQ